eukprot:3382628-Prymnesium_polylepis.2
MPRTKAAEGRRSAQTPASAEIGPKSLAGGARRRRLPRGSWVGFAGGILRRWPSQRWACSSGSGARGGAATRRRAARAATTPSAGPRRRGASAVPGGRPRSRRR